MLHFRTCFPTSFVVLRPWCSKLFNEERKLTAALLVGWLAAVRAFLLLRILFLSVVGGSRTVLQIRTTVRARATPSCAVILGRGCQQPEQQQQCQMLHRLRPRVRVPCRPPQHPGQAILLRRCRRVGGGGAQGQAGFGKSPSPSAAAARTSCFAIGEGWGGWWRSCEEQEEQEGRVPNHGGARFDSNNSTGCDNTKNSNGRRTGCGLFATHAALALLSVRRAVPTRISPSTRKRALALAAGLQGVYVVTTV